MPLNIAKIIKGPAVITYKQATYFSQDDIAINASPSFFDLQSSAYGVVGQRVDDINLATQFIPLGIPSSDIMAVANGIAAKSLNDFMADNWQADSLTNASNTIEIATHGIPDGTPVRIFSQDGAVPAELDEDTLYYTNAPSAGAITLHANQADGIAGSSAIAFTDDGSGTIKLIEQQPLRIQELQTGNYIEFANAVISQLPNMAFGATQQLFSSQLGFRMFPKFGVARVTASSIYTEGNAAVSASLNPAQIITQPYTAAWGSSPWDSFEGREGFTVNFNLSTADDQADSIGVGMISLQDLTVQVQGQPVGITQTAMLAALKLQGTGAVRGATLGGDDLNLVGTGVYFRLYNALLNQGGLAFSSTNQRLNQLTWQASRTVTDGVADPLFFLGTAAPA